MNPNSNPLTNAVGPNDLIRVVQEGYAGLATPRQLAAGLPGAFVLAQSGVLAGVLASVTGTLTETVLATVTIPAGALGPNGILRYSGLYKHTGTAGAKTVFARLNGNAIMNTTRVATETELDFLRTLRAAGLTAYAQSNIALYAPGVTSLASSGNTAIDWTVANTLTFSASLASTADSCSLIGYTVEILNP